MRRLLLLAALLLFAGSAFAQTPVVNDLSPASVTAGNTGFTLVINGSGFTVGSAVFWNGTALTTTFISASHLSAVVPGNILTASGAVQITVFTSSTSNVAIFQVLSVVPQVRAWTPTYFTAGSDAFVTIYGSGFLSNAKVYFDWIPVTTSYVSSTQVNAAISGIHISTSGTNHSIHIVNGVPVAPTKTISVSPQTLGLGSSVIGVTSSPQTVTVTNTGSATVNIASLTIGGVNLLDFASPSTTCGGPLLATNSCTADVTVTPAALGLRIGSLSVADDAVGSPQTINLTGTGTPTLTVSITVAPPSLDFGRMPQGIASPSQDVVITNTGLPNYVISSIVPGGPDIADFVDTGNCAAGTYASGLGCHFTETLTPSNVAPESASIVITDNAPGSPRTISLAGLGVLPGPVVNILPTSMAFGNVTQSTPSSPVTVTLKNLGTTNLTISAIAVSASTFSADFVKSGTGCSTSTVLIPGDSCPVTATFTPSTTGVESANISISDNAVGSPHLIPMSGTGQAAGAGHHMDLTWAASTSTNIVGYNVYRGTSNGGPYTLLTPTPVTSLSYTDSAVTSGTTYFYVITAVGTNPPYSPTESLNSTQTSATIP